MIMREMRFELRLVSITENCSISLFSEAIFLIRFAASFGDASGFVPGKGSSVRPGKPHSTQSIRRKRTNSPRILSLQKLIFMRICDAKPNRMCSFDVLQFHPHTSNCISIYNGFARQPINATVTFIYFSLRFSSAVFSPFSASPSLGLCTLHLARSVILEE